MGQDAFGNRRSPPESPLYDDQFKQSHDYFLAPTALEYQLLTSGTITSFSSSLVTGSAYTFTSIGGTSWITLNGGSPSLLMGTGSNLGVPIPNGATIPYFIAHSGSTVPKATTGDVGTVLVLYLASSAPIR